MSLLQELQSLDLSAIVDARATIRVTLDTDDIKAIVQGGTSVTALGDFGQALQQLRDGLENPADLLRPLMDAMGALSGKLGIDNALFDRYLSAVREGAGILVGLFEGIDGDPALFGQNFGRSMGQALEVAGDLASRYLPVSLDDVNRFKTLVERIDGDVPVDPRLFAELALDALSPFSRAGLGQIRSNLDLILNAVGTVTIDTSLTAPLVAAFDAVATANSPAELQAALNALNTTRSQVLQTITAHFNALASAIGSLPLDAALSAIDAIAGSLQTAGEDILGTLRAWRREIAQVRQLIENIDAARIAGILKGFVDQGEAMARAQYLSAVDHAVEYALDWARGLMRHLGLQALRNEIRDFILGIAGAIRDAELDRVATEARNLVVDLRETIAGADLGDAVRAALEDVEQKIQGVLSGVINALADIGSAVNGLAGQAQGILERAAQALADFKTAADNIASAIENLGIEEATQQVIDKLVDIRETAEALLSAAPLPEPLRGQVNQLIDLVQGIDVDSVFDPVREAVARFDIPDSVVTDVTASLQSVQEVVRNLIPAELIESIEAEIQSVLDVIRGFNPASLLQSVTDFIQESAGFIEGISISTAVQGIAQPFQSLLDALDSLHPERILQPVIEAYDSLIGRIPSPSPETVIRKTTSAVGAASETFARTATEPVRNFLPTPTGSATAPVPEPEPTLPGDFVRLLGFIPNKLRETLAGLEAGPAGQVLSAIDGFTGGLARNLRRVSAEVSSLELRLEDGLDDLLSPLGTAQARAQLAVRAKFSTNGVDFQGALSITAGAGPGALREALLGSAMEARTQARNMTGKLGGGIGRTLEQAAALLERSSLAGLTGNLDSFLAALDPEPIAAELDALVNAVMEKLPELLSEFRDLFAATMMRLQSLMEELNPGTQAQKFLRVLDVIREELDALNPRRLAADLAEVHAAMRAAIAAYDPRVLAGEIDGLLDEIAASLRNLSPENLLGDIDFLEETVALVENAVPTEALSGIGESLAEVGATLQGLDLAALLESIENLGPRVVESFEQVVQAVKNEVLALLESLRFASGSVSVSVEVEVNP